MIENILLLALLAFICYKIGYAKARHDLFTLMAEIAVQKGYRADNEGNIVKTSPILDAELVDDTICLYDNKIFVCQARSLEEIAKFMEHKKDSVIVEFQKEFYVLKEGSVKKTQVKNES
jgi:hypothetical protein